MTKRQNIFATVGLAIACGIAFRAAYWKSKSVPLSVVPVETSVAQNNQSVPAANPMPAFAATPPETLRPIGEKPDENLDTGDGKDVADGKEVLDGRDVLPPVGEFVPSRQSAFDPGASGPPMEHAGKSHTLSDPKKDPLLQDPNPANISGPVVSQETR